MSRLNQNDLVYEGYFFLPFRKFPDPLRWTYGGETGAALTFCPGRNSLMGAGHRNHPGFVSEVRVPDSLEGHPEAEIIQPFGDLCPGEIRDRFKEHHLDEFGGLVAIGERIFWCWHKYYSVQGWDFLNVPTHGWSNIDLETANPQGPYQLGTEPGDGTEGTDEHPVWSADYMCEIPRRHSQTLGGHRIATGKAWGPKSMSFGPSLFAQAVMRTGNHFNVKPLLRYDKDHLPPSFHKVDRYYGVSWIDTPDSTAVVFLGVKASGREWYGPGGEGPDGLVDECGAAKGYHAENYQAELVLYDPTHLVQVAAGNAETWDPRPYDRVDLTQYLHNKKCPTIGALAYDAVGKRLFFYEGYRGTKPYNSDPCIHVLRLNDSTTVPVPPDPVGGTIDVSIDIGDKTFSGVLTEDYE